MACIIDQVLLLSLHSTVSEEDYLLENDIIIFGTASGAEECISVTIFDDDAVEGNHSFTVVIVSVSSPTRIGDSNSTTVMIADNDSE